MITKRPGHAAVQYDDARGEAAADFADALSSARDVAKQLGFEVKGLVVGISMYAATTYGDEVSVTIQTLDGGSWGDVEEAVQAADGILDVREQSRLVPVVEFIRCFKRLNVGLFVRDTAVREVRVVGD